MIKTEGLPSIGRFVEFLRRARKNRKMALALNIDQTFLKEVRSHEGVAGTERCIRWRQVGQNFCPASDRNGETFEQTLWRWRKSLVFLRQANRKMGDTIDMKKEIWKKTRVELFRDLDCDAQGLTGAEAAKRLAQNGPNELRAERQKSTIRIFLEQFADFLVILLIVAAAVSIALGDAESAVVILAVITMPMRPMVEK